ncbi:MAG TPA: methyltransferase domain-containing protein [Cyclobacteriaceae bacterium]
MKTSGFDFLAPVYDSMARFFFGRSIMASQSWFFNKIPAGSRILILGGGTGWILEELQKCDATSTIWYVEISSAMMKRAQHWKVMNDVHFILGTEEMIPPGLVFDVVITNFYLDLFSDDKLKWVVQHINRHTSSPTTWLVADFIDGKIWWQRLMLKTMYLFFNVVCDIQAKQLPHWHKRLEEQGWKEIHGKFWYGTFIKSTLWKRA